MLYKWLWISFHPGQCTGLTCLEIFVSVRWNRKICWLLFFFEILWFHSSIYLWSNSWWRNYVIFHCNQKVFFKKFKYFFIPTLFRFRGWKKRKKNYLHLQCCYWHKTPPPFTHTQYTIHSTTITWCKFLPFKMSY